MKIHRRTAADAFASLKSGLVGLSDAWMLHADRLKVRSRSERRAMLFISGWIVDRAPAVPLNQQIAVDRGWCDSPRVPMNTAFCWCSQPRRECIARSLPRSRARTGALLPGHGSGGNPGSPI